MRILVSTCAHTAAQLQLNKKRAGMAMFPHPRNASAPTRLTGGTTVQTGPLGPIGEVEAVAGSPVA